MEASQKMIDSVRRTARRQRIGNEMKRRQFFTLMRHRAAFAAALVGAEEDADIHVDRRFKGRQLGTRNINRGRSSWATEYLSQHPIYSSREFRQRFCVPRAMFHRIHGDLVATYPKVWATREDAARKAGIPSQIKVLVCLHILGTGRAFDDVDDSAKMAPETARKYFKLFCRHVVELYGDSFLNRRPSVTQLDKIEQKYAEQGFVGCAGAVGCCTILWKNCPTALKGKYQKSKNSNMASIQVEAWCDRDLYCWHWSAGRCGTTNDKAMIQSSPLFNNILSGTYDFRLSQRYRVFGGGSYRELPYFLVDSVYPEWPLFAKPGRSAQSQKELAYIQRQQTLRKDIDRFFGVLQARFGFLRKKCLLWYKEDIIVGSRCCVTLHNMMVRMAQQGDFLEDDVESPGVDVVAEIYREANHANGSNSLYGRVQDDDSDEEADDDFEDGLETYAVRPEIMTERSAFVSLRNDLIRSLSPN